MQIESILIFVVLIALTSLANKRKKAQQHHKKQQPTYRPQQAPENTNPPVSEAKPKRSQKRSLQDIFSEMQSELEAEYKKASGVDVQKNQPQQQQRAEKAIAKKKSAAEKSQKTSAKRDVPEPSEETKKKSPIYGNEIRDTGRSQGIEINAQTVLNGIIFSEILGKPKGQR